MHRFFVLSLKNNVCDPIMCFRNCVPSRIGILSLSVCSFKKTLTNFICKLLRFELAVEAP